MSSIVDDEVCTALSATYPLTARWPVAFQRVFIAQLALRLLGHGGAGALAAVNPGLPDEKAFILDRIAERFSEHVPRYVRCDLGVMEDKSASSVLNWLERHGLDMPVVAKPDLGLQGLMVFRLDNEQALAQYLDQMARCTPGSEILFQSLVTQPVEFTAFYSREPNRSSGRVFALVLRRMPFVVGNGKASLRDLIVTSGRPHYVVKNLLREHALDLQQVPAVGSVIRLGFARNLSHGGIYTDISDVLTPTFEQRIESIVQSMGEMHFCRFDLRCDSLNEAMYANRFSILEVNGTLSADLRPYADNVKLLKAISFGASTTNLLARTAIQAIRCGYPAVSRREYWRRLVELRGIVKDFSGMESTSNIGSAHSGLSEQRGSSIADGEKQER